jgi:hypothetical protein
MSSLSSGSKNKREVGSKQNFMLLSCSAYCSALKMNATCSFETLVDFQRTIRSYILKVRTLHNHHRGNLKFCHYILCNDTLRTGRPVFEMRQRRPDIFFAPLSRNQLNIQRIV